LVAQAANDVKMVSWYINNQFIKTAEKNKPVFIVPTLGKLKIPALTTKAETAIAG
jgi:membrane carboxypeptidase/penicillin-binding protein PbpC